MDHPRRTNRGIRSVQEHTRRCRKGRFWRANLDLNPTLLEGEDANVR